MNLNGLFQFFGGQNAFNSKLSNFGQNCQSQGINPEQRVQELLNSGRMSQEQFNRFAAIANTLTGRK